MFYLDFEDKIEKLSIEKSSLINLVDSKKTKNKIISIDKKTKKEFEKIYNNLSPWQIVKIARHPLRPKTLDYISNLFDDFIYLSGDRLFAEDNSIISGLAKFNGQTVALLGTEKGNDLVSRIKYNFGMARPEGYRKSQRIMKLAEKLQIPLICFIDTSGAYPGKDAEERGQAEAIAKSIQVSLNVKTPIISIIIGEGGSGGAIALATSDKVLMLSNSIYSVISPEGCSSILWKSSAFSEIAASSLKLTAKNCFDLNIIDEIIKEPIGAAHREKHLIFDLLKKSIIKHLTDLQKIEISELKKIRNNRYLNYLV